MTSVFTKIINGELPAKKVFENERIIVIHDIRPAAPIHLLIISKKEIQDLQSVTAEEMPIVIEMITCAQQLATQFGISDAYRLLTNNGSKAGQTIFHLHFHLLGGRDLGILG